MPVVGFGTYLIKDEDARASVHYAIRSGYRHVDTAETYRNEKGVGLGIKAIR
jgi:diketogulonate reductase-like aldo/keto reductase